jgi:ribosomal protein S18 acetylase RimI-like enzyme
MVPFSKKILIGLLGICIGFEVRSDISFREASEQDFFALVDVHYSAWHAAYDGLLDRDYCLKNTPERLAHYWRKFFVKQKQDNRFVLVAVDGDKIIGFAAAGPLKLLPEETDIVFYEQNCAELYKVYVNPASQHQGIGKKLMKLCSEHLFSQHYTNIIVRVFEQNQQAILFYEKFGARLVIQEAITNPQSPSYKIYQLLCRVQKSVLL